jgi:RimJ/RimL family protein N-acetyltransferase
MGYREDMPMAAPPPRIYVDKEVSGTRLVFRDIAHRDVDAIAAYWHDKSDARLRILGVQRSALGSEDDIRRRLTNLVPKEEGHWQERRAFVIEFDGTVVGYTNVHIIEEGRAFAHIHFLTEEMRAKGLGSLIMVSAVRAVMPIFGVQALMFQTRPSNRPINILLRRVFGLEPQKRYVAQPNGGLASPGELYCWELLLSHAQTLSDPLESAGAWTPPARDTPWPMQSRR